MTDSDAQYGNIVFRDTDFPDVDDNKQKKEVSSAVHIRVQQRSGRKMLTTVQGLATDLDLKKIVKAFKKTFSTNGTILKDEELGEIIQVQGDQRKNIAEFLVKYKICEKGDIKVHGF